jgi:hypothetical protein
MEKPILFRGEMVRAILSGTKTQTRRVAKYAVMQLSPYGQAGDRLWVRETFCRPRQEFGQVLYRADGVEHPHGPRTPAIHMPRTLSRITLEIIEVRLQKLQDITEDDAKAELSYGLAAVSPARDLFMVLWNTINDKRGYVWAVNPWVWAITFKRILP